VSDPPNQIRRKAAFGQLLTQFLGICRLQRVIEIREQRTKGESHGEDFQSLDVRSSSRRWLTEELVTGRRAIRAAKMPELKRN
jgi:hypothetical protein